MWAMIEKLRINRGSAVFAAAFFLGEGWAVDSAGAEAIVGGARGVGEGAWGTAYPLSLGGAYRGRAAFAALGRVASELVARWRLRRHRDWLVAAYGMGDFSITRILRHFPCKNLSRKITPRQVIQPAISTQQP